MKSFRIWDKKHDGKGRYVPNDFIQQIFLNMNGRLIWWSHVGFQDVSDIMDYEFSTGQRDKNDKLIYEGDIYRSGSVTDYNGNTRNFYQVVKNEVSNSSSHGHGASERSEHIGFLFSSFYGGFSNEIEIIGNIKMNPELLESN